MKKKLRGIQRINKNSKCCRFSLRKWSSNCSSILKHILDNCSNTDNLIEFHDKELKTLGLAWKVDKDTLNYFVNSNSHNPVTKRTVLANISKIFNPLGLIDPTVIHAKLFMQHLWRQRVDWDEPITGEFSKWWMELSTQFTSINDISIPRQVLSDEPSIVQLLDFCDANECAYGTCIFLVSIDKHGIKHSRLLCAKSKVAPQTKCTLPRLELLAAVLLARLGTIIHTTLNINISKTRYYSDSTIVLSWLRIDPSQLKTFVTNRVAKITELADVNDWRHVASSFNAADVISRDITPWELRELKIWWYGPEFLADYSNSDVDMIHSDTNLNDEVSELKETIIGSVTRDIERFDLFDKFSSFTKLLNGPVLIKDGTLRNSKVVKSYLCVFVCFAVRAVHMELVRDLTTDSF